MDKSIYRAFIEQLINTNSPAIIYSDGMDVDNDFIINVMPSGNSFLVQIEVSDEMINK